MSQTAYRTHHATEVTEELVGQKVTLSGWVDRRRDHGGVAFIDLRDNTGLVQVVIYDDDSDTYGILFSFLSISSG